MKQTFNFNPNLFKFITENRNWIGPAIVEIRVHKLTEKQINY